MNKELDFIKDMFDRIAPRYDFLNRLLSMRQDIVWRTQMVKATALQKNSMALDVACGTCDVALEISSQLKGHAQIFGLDFSFGMLRFGKQKLLKKNINLLNANALNLPFKHHIFDAVFIAFGIRNIMDRQKAIKAFFNVLTKGGRLAVLELTTPEKGIFRSLYLLYFQKILPILGSFFSKDNNAYSYLPDSVLKFPSPVEFSRLMKGAGFENIKFKQMTFGIVTLFVGSKP
ncbi:MAG: bifunctional demethylmenaquinone methyltransferase/2-methoxy-6-polyprenyl-1,4-benzoquinol methylase UbiE [Desulfobacula sp.]|uniref:bifunctional demethylmenaquinone methyltransferase/2-methoxy-6-polyprenyl-1,4-benzoquinol methylase UbiE n=1 Tax=Desulfobacula sp. TaxID=2593537 RepID=UPI0025BE82F1|nr:bifunctional demethylmenaquinone methyltransferase/2-methoxy-6-polyprenyl-1,4-benzoquinol methylase UbiE [Desulfobacula sp.]MCD4719755.1 bifunctional demethylmenaquinone methyltransferase/2-methoxy-6-polyprenyl-1,4-benzoquinol methylase UbiE [Desulfobacula sp.]